MAEPRCPPWEYDKDPTAQAELPKRSRLVLLQLAAGRISADSAIADSRPIHHTLFEGLVPPQCPYYAGHYRGEDFLCLREYEVGIQADPRVGCPSDVVLTQLREFIDNTLGALTAIDAAQTLPDAQLPAEQKLLFLVNFACLMFVEFLRIHPYANGNGHVARFLVWCVLGRHGYWPKKWPLNNRPPDPPYSRLIAEYRDGRPDLFEAFVLKCILGEI